jgi:MoCo/4Fe-4S cofactor protein with predicted Tat translocation signal
MSLVQISNDKKQAPKYWRSLDDLAGKPEFRDWVTQEFPSTANDMISGDSRRQMIKIMAASMGLAGLVACRRPEQKILAFARGVENYIPGKPLFYNTVMQLGGAAQGLRVEANDGRPTKVEGNPEHPHSKGAALAWHQASLLNLYDPDRLKNVFEGTAKSDWDKFAAFAKTHFSGVTDGAGLAFVLERDSSPSLASVKAQVAAKWPKATWVEYEALTRDEELLGVEMATGQVLQPHYQFDQASVIVSLDSDFLGTETTTALPIRQFAAGRRLADGAKSPMSRLYVIEGQYSSTGAEADHRLRVKTSEVGAFAAELLKEVGGTDLKILNNGNAKVRKYVAAIAKDLKAAGAKALVVAGPRQPAAVHALALQINALLGSVGNTVVFTQPLFAPVRDAMKNLVAAMNSGAISTLLVAGANPALSVTADLDFAAAMKKVKTTIHLGQSHDETGKLAGWCLPQAHYLESWSDARAIDGTASIQQPLIQAIYDGRTTAETLSMIAGMPTTKAWDIVHNYWLNQFTVDKEAGWRKAVHDGIAGTGFALVKPLVDTKKAISLPTATQGFDLTFPASAATYDGRFANNAWMLEAPDPLTKLVWDNALMMSSKAAKELGLTDGDIVKVSAGGREIEAAIMRQPGQADGSLTLSLGWGRQDAGRVGNDFGFNAYPLRGSTTQGFVTGVTLTKTGSSHKLVTTQEHHYMEERPLVREASLSEFQKNEDFVKDTEPHSPERVSLFPDWDYDKGNQWGMVIDLNSCIGCNACLVACQSENNIPVVGKEQVYMGREMHWIRLDRYYSGKSEEGHQDEDPQVVMQPIACQHCENAPCESVCPVAATVHSPEGLNDMAYNRCVGTRYCANNCPYKVRRFNYFDWHKNFRNERVAEPATYPLAQNPDVSVRMRGIMEKCTYCTQRIQEKKIELKASLRSKGEQLRTVLDSDGILTACQQTCPTEAITFGNINDPKSKVSQLRNSPRNYQILAEINVRPRTSFLGKVRNLNPELVEAPAGGAKKEAHG